MIIVQDLREGKLVRYAVWARGDGMVGVKVCPVGSSAGEGRRRAAGRK